MTKFGDEDAESTAATAVLTGVVFGIIWDQPKGLAPGDGEVDRIAAWAPTVPRRLEHHQVKVR